MTKPESFIAETTFAVRYAETDAMGVVYHSNYIIYFEVGRAAYLEQLGYSYVDLEDLGFALAVTDLQVRYIKAMQYGQRVTVRAWITDQKSRTVTFGYEILDAETRDVCVTGETKHICITKEGKVARFPTEWLPTKM